MQVNTLFVELDALLDTRLATLFLLDNDYVKRAAQEGYVNRLFDSWSFLSNTAFREHYSKRTKDTLKNSIMTNMLKFITEFNASTILNSQNGPVGTRPKIVVNTYPYTLTEAETTMLLASVIRKTNSSSEVEVVHLSYSELTPSYLRQNVSIIALYDATLWLECHSATQLLKTSGCPEVTLLTAHSGVFVCGEKEYKAYKAMHKLSPIEALETVSSVFIDLKVVSSSVFSTNIKPLQDKTA